MKGYNVIEIKQEQQPLEGFIWNQIVHKDIKYNIILWVFWPVLMYILKFVQYWNHACWDV